MSLFDGFVLLTVVGFCIAILAHIGLRLLAELMGDYR